MIVSERYYGSIDSRSLHLRWCIPFAFTRWDGNDFRFCWRELFDLRNWWDSVRCRSEWRLWAKRHKDSTHRCYCQDGWMFDGTVLLGGWGVQWFYSVFTGDIPCVCDEAIASLDD